MKTPAMRNLMSAAGLLVLVAGWTAGAGAQTRPSELRLEEVTSPAGLAVDKLKPKEIAFIDRPNDELIYPDA